jgi:hypothetical protein
LPPSIKHASNSDAAQGETPLASESFAQKRFFYFNSDCGSVQRRQPSVTAFSTESTSASRNFCDPKSDKRPDDGRGEGKAQSLIKRPKRYIAGQTPHSDFPEEIGQKRIKHKQADKDREHPSDHSFHLPSLHKKYGSAGRRTVLFYSIFPISTTNNESNTVDAKGSKIGLPKMVKRKSPGNFPIPTFCNQGSSAENRINAKKILKNQRNMRAFPFPEVKCHCTCLPLPTYRRETDTLQAVTAIIPLKMGRQHNSPAQYQHLE